MTVPKGKYPGKTHARKVVEYIQQHGGKADGVLYLEGQKQQMLEDSDEPVPFRQRRYFFYLTGCAVPDCYFTYDIEKQKSTLFIPPVDSDEVIWSGLPMSTEEALKKYEVDEVRPATEVNPYLASSEVSSGRVYAINNQVSDHITFLSFGEKDFSLLKTAIDECRVVKTPYEIELIRHANEVSTAAHKALMGAAKSATNERELEAVFLKECMARGCRDQAYPSIVASGANCATLHYPHNNADLEGKLNMLIDAGAEYDCYASDITRGFPIYGTFTKESREIYDLVLKMQKECIEMVKEGALWDDIHAHAHRVAIRGLLDIGILKGNADDIFNARTSAAFLPHGLGHYLGMDTHDTGGHPNFADKDKMFRYLRLRGHLPAGSVVTVEPGVYFCRFIIEPYLEDEVHKQYINREVLDRYWTVGGVRIEDNILVTKSGYENLTATPKEVDEVLNLING